MNDADNQALNDFTTNAAYRATWANYASADASPAGAQLDHLSAPVSAYDVYSNRRSALDARGAVAIGSSRLPRPW